jgi:hypothetical protein
MSRLARRPLSLTSTATTLSGALLLGGLLVGTLPAPTHAAPPAQFVDARGTQARGRIACRVTENGGAASGTMIVRKDGAEVASGPCGEPVGVPPGSYEVALGLDGALDRPTQAVRVDVAPGGTGLVAADFQTAILEVRIEAEGRRAAGMATIFRNGERVGTLGSGVAGHLSAGTYDVVARYRGAEQRFDAVTLAPAERRSLTATF